MIAKVAKKDLKDCEIINYWANAIVIRRQLMKEDGLYLDEVYLLSLIYVLNKKGPAKQTDLRERFNILSYQRDKMLNNLLSRGFIKNDIEGPSKAPRPHRIVVSSLGEQLLIKYEKSLRKLCSENNKL
jgi:DNA-binding MarR family transcriptional regulator